jgi:transcriptional regulator with XRE-family HTH domain
MSAFHQRQLVEPTPWIITDLRNIRTESNITAVALAQYLEVNIQTLHRWEAGEADPPARRLIQWAEALGYTFDLHVVENRETLIRRRFK